MKKLFTIALAFAMAALVLFILPFQSLAGTGTEAGPGTLTEEASAADIAAEKEAEAPLSWERSVALMNINNSTVRKLRNAQIQAYRQYQSSALQAGTIDTRGFTVNFGGIETFIYYNDETRVAMTKIKELMPEQLKFSWEAAGQNRIITENTLKTGLRGVFYGVYNAQADLQLKQKQLDFCMELHRQDKIRFNRDMISDIELQESEYNLTEAQKDAAAAKRNYENAVRSFNQYVGLLSKTRYTRISYDEAYSRLDLKPVDSYITEALANRFDITGIQKQIVLKQQEKKIIESGYTYKISTTAQDEYERLLNDLEQIGADLEGNLLSVADEIRNAYVDVVNTGKSVDNLFNTLKLQRKNYENMKLRYEAGMISKNSLTQGELGLMQVENAYNAVLFDYNTRIMRFKNAAGIGPAY